MTRALWTRVEIKLVFRFMAQKEFQQMQGMKCKSKQLSNAVTLQLNHALSTPSDNFCLQPKRMYYLLYIKATLFINFCATAIVSTWVVLLKDYNGGSSSTCLKPFSRSIFLRTKAHWLTLASQSEALKLKLLFLLLDIFYKILHAHVNIMIKNFLFLPVAILLFIFPALKPRTSKHPNQIYANKKNSFMV